MIGRNILDISLRESILKKLVFWRLYYDDLRKMKLFFFIWNYFMVDINIRTSNDFLNYIEDVNKLVLLFLFLELRLK